LGGKQPEVAKQPARVVEDRLRGEGGQLIALVRFEERSKADVMSLEFVKKVPERSFIADATDDDVRMLQLGRKKGSRRLDGGHGRTGRSAEREAGPCGPARTHKEPTSWLNSAVGGF